MTAKGPAIPKGLIGFNEGLLTLQRVLHGFKRAGVIPDLPTKLPPALQYPLVLRRVEAFRVPTCSNVEAPKTKDFNSKPSTLKQHIEQRPISLTHNLTEHPKHIKPSSDLNAPNPNSLGSGARNRTCCRCGSNAGRSCYWKEPTHMFSKFDILLILLHDLRSRYFE